MGGKSKTHIGDKFFIGMHHIICQAPIDEIQEIKMGEKTIWSGGESTNTTISINKPEIFGGKKKEGGVVGNIDFMFGDEAQTTNSYLTSILGNSIPAFRLLIGTVWKQCYVSAMTPYIKGAWYKVKSIKGKEWYSAKAEINGANNPAHMAYYVITELMNNPASAIDEDAFIYAADTFYSEGLGLSMMISGGTLEKFIEDIERHSHSIIDQDPISGLYYMKPLRDDYNIGDAPLFNESNVKKLESFDRASYGSLVNEIIVKYRPQGTDKEEPLTFHNLASIQAQGAVVQQTISYPGIDSESNAIAAAARDLPLVSTALARISFIANRSGATLTKGDIIRFSWGKYNLDEVGFRVISVDYGNLRNREIKITAVEDIFAAPTSTYLGGQTTLFTDPIQPASEPNLKKLVELNYWDVAYSRNSSELVDFDENSAFVGGMISEENSYISDWELWDKVGGASYALKATDYPAPTAEVSSAVGFTDTVIQIENTTSGINFIVSGNYAYVGEEIVRVTAISPTQITVARGCNDTVPAQHAIGAVIWFAEDFIAADETEYSESVTIDAKSLMRTGEELFPLASASNASIVLQARYGKPWPPGNVKVNGVAYPTSITGNLLLTWSHRDRTQQLVKPIIDTTATDIGPEVDVEYEVIIYASDGTTVLRDITGITTNTWEWTDELLAEQDTSNRIVLKTFRDGIESHQYHDFYVDRNY